ncbi:uncharacterized protein LOC110191788 [Drosophila serrata]|uniref:uncharacterized protein LOC110191788 n=1 Tax=Drosophila serrata TaxID=7274 RepID=UPI000A1D3053|nr:uncharacterized protein LOC110191788 [Drosophila serrata]
MWRGTMGLPVQVPSQLTSLLSCGLCRRPYDLETRRLPKELVCQHSFCEECLARSLIRETYECLCPICGARTALLGRKLPETKAIMFLLRELPALVLGRAMLGFSRGSSSSIEVVGEQQAFSSGNWVDQICVNSFLASSSEHCLIHAMPNSTWCHSCQLLLCRACADGVTHRDHRLTRQLDYLELMRQLLSVEVSKIKRAATQVSELAARELNLLRQLCEACFRLQLHVKRETQQHKASLVSHQMNGWSVRAEHELNSCSALHSGTDLRNLLSRFVIQRRKCERQLVEVHFQCRMRAGIQENGMQVLDFDSLNNRVLKLRNNPRPGSIPANVEPPPALILTNYCVFAYWNELQNRLMPSKLLPQSRVTREVQPEERNQNEVVLARYFSRAENFNREREGSINSVSSSASNSSSLQRQQEMNLRLAHEELRLQQQLHQQQVEQQQQQQQQTLAIFRQDDPNWSHGLRPILAQHDNSRSSHLVSIARPPTVHCYPIYYMDMDMAGELAGRVLVEVRDDVAPRMSKNFGSLIRHDRGYGYRGCSVFQAWGGESIICGDFECNNGRGGHSTFDTRYFMPDDTGLPAHRGTVGMRRGQRRQDRSGFVGSQFRLVLNEMRSFTAIFGYIVEGIEVVDRIAATGNAIGRLAVKCIIRNCGEYHINR